MKEFRGKHGKVTDLMKEEMKKMRAEGFTQSQIASECGISQPVVCYHLSPGQKEKAKQRVSENRKIRGGYSKTHPEKRREYMREYMRDRYNNDPEFRKRMIARVMNSRKRNVRKRERT